MRRWLSLFGLADLAHRKCRLIFSRITQHLFEFGEPRNRKTATFFCSQFDVAGWYLKIVEPTVADAVCDRTVNDSYTIKSEILCESTLVSANKMTAWRLCTILEHVYDCGNRLVRAGDTSYTYDAENSQIAVFVPKKRRPMSGTLLRVSHKSFSLSNSTVTSVGGRLHRNVTTDPILFNEPSHPSTPSPRSPAH